MPIKKDERLEELEIAQETLETLEMMIQLIKALGFEPPSTISQRQGTTGAKAVTLQEEKLNNIYQGYASMLEDREKQKIKIDSLVAQNAKMRGTAKEPSGSQQKKASSRRAKRRGNPWDRPRKRQRQPNHEKKQLSKSPLSNEIVSDGNAV